MNEFSSHIKTAQTDEYYTPAEYVEMIVPYLVGGGYKKILCPFDTEQSEYVKVLSKDFDVTFSHINTGTDFFSIDNLHDYDAVVSNPPFSKRQEILQKLYRFDIPFALILNLNGLFDSTTRYMMFKENGVELLIPLGRMRFINPDLSRNSPSFQSCYVCNKMLHKQIVFDGICSKAQNNNDLIDLFGGEI